MTPFMFESALERKVASQAMQFVLQVKYKFYATHGEFSYYYSAKYTDESVVSGICGVMKFALQLGFSDYEPHLEAARNIEKRAAQWCEDHSPKSPSALLERV